MVPKVETDDVAFTRFIKLFGANGTTKNRWIIDSPEDETKQLIKKVPKLLVLTNLIDMSYNYTDGATYHTRHFNDLHSIRQNTPGFVACHMFAEYLVMIGRAKSYTHALELIQSQVSIYVETNNDRLEQEPSLTELDWYIGMSYANATWRQAAIYRDRCTEGDWLKPFSTIYKENGATLAKDYVQLRMCAYLLLEPKLPNNLHDLKFVSNSNSLLDIASFPISMQTYVEGLKKCMDNAKAKSNAAVGGKAKKATKKVVKRIIKVAKK